MGDYRTGRDAVQFRVRMPATLHERIKLSAIRNNRTMNDEVFDVLEEAFPPLDDTDPLTALKLAENYISHNERALAGHTDCEELRIIQSAIAKLKGQSS